MLKTTSGSSPRIDLSNNITYCQSQSHATVPLNVLNYQIETNYTGYNNYSQASGVAMVSSLTNGSFILLLNKHPQTKYEQCTFTFVNQGQFQLNKREVRVSFLSVSVNLQMKSDQAENRDLASFGGTNGD